MLTDAGKKAFDAAMRLQTPWINRLSETLRVTEIETTHSVLMAVRQKLEGNEYAEEQA